MKQFLSIFLLLFCQDIYLPVWAGSSIILRGERCDYLYNADSAEVWKGSEVFKVKKWKKLEVAYYFACKKSLFRLSKGEITCSDSDWRVTIPDSVLPVPSSAASIQNMVHDGNLYLPIRTGFLVLNLEKQSKTLLAYHWQMKPRADAGMGTPIPEMAEKGGSLWSLDSGHLHRLETGAWKDIMAIPEKDLIDSTLLTGSRFANLILFKVTQGDLGSFRTRVISFSTGSGKHLLDKEFSGILKNPGIDASGKVVFEYVKASIFSAIMGRDKVRLRIVDPGSGKEITRNFDVGDKRRHLFFVESGDGGLLIIVQCKNGDVFMIEPFSGKFRELKSGKFGYDYTLIRGIGHGVFYNEKSGNRIAVSFGPGPGGS
ncbi:MAG: hypothetical protein CO090_05585 [Acidobacteria bacterium CG_4_9_14_3_um_filter_49_7]|nr:MAG: hypothetical protein CO090_05585 [Acidobacteria bacterium CG_4_9_14_3_um_filter_49_7]